MYVGMDNGADANQHTQNHPPPPPSALSHPPHHPHKTHKTNRGSASEEDFDEASPNGGGGSNGGVGQKGEEEADAVMSHLVLDDRTWFLAEAFRVCAFGGLGWFLFGGLGGVWGR